jgi:hypothetical protein
MPSPDLIAPGRLEELLGGALPEAEQEARLQGIVRELRADAPAAPAPLRARVRALEDQPARRRRALPRRRTALALAFVLLAVGLVGAGVRFAGEPNSDNGDDSADVGAAAAAGEVTVEASVLPAIADGGSATQEATQARLRDAVVLGKADRLAAPLPASGRATDISLWMEVRLPDADELSAAVGEAMGITRELGGWVAASDIDTKGAEGTAELALRVPVGRVEDAVVRLGALGTVTGQRVETVDLQAGIDRRAGRIELIERSIRVLELRLQSGTLTPAEELDVRLRLERHRNAISDLRRENLADRREAATSELALVLHTREAPAKEKEDESGAAGVARDALDVLAAAGAIALFLAIVLSPVLLLVVLLWLALRARSRRQETRLLERPDPAVPPPA